MISFGRIAREPVKANLCAFLLLLAIALHPASGNAGWQMYGVADGLADTDTHAVIEDRLGNIWFATTGGVSRYDGLNWKTFAAAAGVPGSVSSITEDLSGDIWVADGGEVSRFDGSAWRHYSAADTFPIGVSVIKADHLGNLWLGTRGNGVSRFDGHTWKTYTFPDGPGGTTIYSITEDHLGNVWFGTSGGASRFDGTSWRTYTTVDSLASDVVLGIAEDASGNYWFATTRGVSRFDGRTWKTYVFGEFPDNAVFCVTADRLGNVWIGNYTVFRFDGRDWRSYSGVDGFPGFDLRTMTVDQSGNLWVGTATDGAARYDNTSLKTFTMADGLPDNFIHALLEDDSLRLWCGTNQGASTFDGSAWKIYSVLSTFNGLANDTINAMAKDLSGNLWFGTRAGISRFDGSSWKTFTTDSGLANNIVSAITVDLQGDIWVGSTWGGGVSRLHANTWKVYTDSTGLLSNFVYQMATDSSGNVWCVHGGGLSRYDGVGWQTYTNDVPAIDQVNSLTVDHEGMVWIGTIGGGASRFDGHGWQTYTSVDGLGGDVVAEIVDDLGSLWFATAKGFSRFDGTSWWSYPPSSSFPDPGEPTIADHVGTLWSAHYARLTRYEPDRVAPQTVLLGHPPPLSGSRDQSVSFVAAFEETKVDFSTRLDGGAWSSSWTPVGFWARTGLSDGVHTVEARGRDQFGNIDPVPVSTTFEVDATPPTPVISYPPSGRALHGGEPVIGTASDPRFRRYSLEVRSSGAASWDSVSQSSTPVASDTLGTWETSGLADGDYDIRLSVVDTLGLIGRTQVSVVVDNHFPSAGETTPAVITAATGGHLYTTNQELHLYFPPHAFDQDAVVSMAAAVSATDTLPSGAVRVLPGYDISWSGGTLRKPATMRFASSTADLAAAAPGGAPGTLAIYDSTGSSGWQRLGGTTESGDVALTINQPGRYALFAERSAYKGAGSLSGLAFTPRVFSPTGTFASSDVGISFTLSRPAPVTVRVYTRSGRLVKEVASGQSMNAGVNLVRWDGRDRSGDVAVDGLYLITVEALGQTQRKPLAVVK
jgi:ligand-binding sensor domain-containing protein